MILLLQPMTMGTVSAQSLSQEELDKERIALEKQRKIFEENLSTIQLQINELSSILDTLKNNNVSQDKLEDIEEQLEELYNDKSKLEKSEIDLLERESIFEKQWNALSPKTDTTVEPASIPSWFKSNAQWWKQGIISDEDIINALETLIIQDVIPLDNFIKTSGIEHAAGVPKGGTFVNVYDKPKIPSYQKDVFGFWSEGKVSDSEIVNSIGHLMSKGIINSQKIQEKRDTIVQSSDVMGENLQNDSPQHIVPIPTDDSASTGMIDDDITNDDFTIEASPMSLTLSNGEYGEIIVKTKSLNGWQSPVQITTPIIPSPMTYPPGYPHYVYPTPESETSSMIPVQISGDACTGNYILRIFGYGEHPAPGRVLEIHRVDVEINTVREPSLELDSLEDSITIIQGGSKSFQLSFKSLDYADYSYIMGTVDPFTAPAGVSIETSPTLVWVQEQTTAFGTVTVSTSESTPAPFTFELPIYAETGLDCYNPYREETTVTVNVVPFVDETESMIELIPVTALTISDVQYPISQFTLWQWEGECNDQWHYHSSTGHAISLDGITGIPDPDPENCGFGKVSDFSNLTGWMSQSEIDNFKELTGYDPLVSEAMMGGSGP